MALANLQVFNKEIYKYFHLGVTDNITMFNQATKGAMVLTSVGTKNQGDFYRQTYFTNLGLVRSRNAYADTAISNVTPAMLKYSTVKVGRGTPEIIWNESDYRWSGVSEQGMRNVIMGEQLAEQVVQDMVNTSINAMVSAMANVAAIYNDVSAAPTWTNLWNTKYKRGDRFADIVCWVMHSSVFSQLYVANLANAQNLFRIGDVMVSSDPQGTPIIISDTASLLQVGSPNKYLALGLTGRACEVELNDDYNMNEVRKNGQENIVSSWQAEWSFNLGLKSFTWDETSGGKSPSNAALATAANWDAFTGATAKHFGGVIGRFT